LGKVSHQAGSRLSQRTWPRLQAAHAFGERFLCGLGASSREVADISSSMMGWLFVTDFPRFAGMMEVVDGSKFEPTLDFSQQLLNP
jgi:hypothetical protein